METRKHDYVPRSAGQFKIFMRAILDYTAAKAPVWGHIPARALEELESLFARFYAAFDAAVIPHGPVETSRRRETKDAAAKALRAFVNQYLRFPPVTDIDRIAMGIPVRDSVRTVKNEVSETVEFSIRLRYIRELLIDFWVKGTAHKAKPSSHDGAVVVWGVLSEPPSSHDELTRHAEAGRTPYALRFKEEDRGKTVYIALAWRNGRHVTGAWSEIQSAIIP
jgi:hypothetical protein